MPGFPPRFQLPSAVGECAVFGTLAHGWRAFENGNSQKGCFRAPYLLRYHSLGRKKDGGRHQGRKADVLRMRETRNNTGHAPPLWVLRCFNWVAGSDRDRKSTRL